MPPRARRLNEADQALWTSYASKLLPLRGRMPARPPESKTATVPAAPPPARDPPLRPATAAPSARARRAAAPLTVDEHPGGIDSATWQRFRTGKLAVMRKLDLHGMTAQRAFHALVGFLRSAHAEQVRCVEIITGRGTGESGGVIRREFPHWLNLPEIRPLILGAVHPHALNPGSVRLILRRIR
jgi:DNA-nicking Smr family endonuclease